MGMGGRGVWLSAEYSYIVHLILLRIDYNVVCNKGEGSHIFLTNPCMGFDYTVDQEGLWASFHIRFMLAVIDGISK